MFTEESLILRPRLSPRDTVMLMLCYCNGSKGEKGTAEKAKPPSALKRLWEETVQGERM
jgi:hypothetical protein